MKLLQKLASSSKYYCDKLLSPKSLLDMTISAKGRRKATSRQNRPLRGSWEWGHFEIVCAQHIDGVATVVVKSAMVVMLKTAVTYFVTCQFTETRRMHLQELPPMPFVLLLLRISVFHSKYLHVRSSYFSAISFIDLWASFWHWNYCNRWVFYWVSDNSTSWISSAFLSFSCKIITMTFFVKTTI